jgi:ABC-type branched-subunit amino acid transport system permease subunit
MAKRAALMTLGVVLLLVLFPVAFGQFDTDDRSLTPPAGELWVMALYLVLAAALTFLVSFFVLRRRGQRGALRSAGPPRAPRSRSGA